jgi:hypothetical protein
MLDFVQYFAFIVALILTIGETVIVVRTTKYWPLSMDDYVACALLIYSACTLEQSLSQLLMLMTWAFMIGNLYAMLFTRLEPQGGSRERLGALTVMLLLSLVGAISTLILIVNINS